jgi:hypothetical protein
VLDLIRTVALMRKTDQIGKTIPAPTYVKVVAFTVLQLHNCRRNLSGRRDNTVACFNNWFNSIPGTAVGYLGIALTYLFSGLMAKRQQTTLRGKKMAPAFFFIGCSVFGLLAVLTWPLHLEVRADVDSSKILAFEGIGAALVCAGWLGYPDGKRLSRVMVSLGIAFQVVGAVPVVCSLHVPPFPFWLHIVVVSVVMLVVGSIISAQIKEWRKKRPKKDEE